MLWEVSLAQLLPPWVSEEDDDVDPAIWAVIVPFSDREKLPKISRDVILCATPEEIATQEFAAVLGSSRPVLVAISFFPDSTARDLRQAVSRLEDLDVPYCIRTSFSVWTATMNNTDWFSSIPLWDDIVSSLDGDGIGQPYGGWTSENVIARTLPTDPNIVLIDLRRLAEATEAAKKRAMLRASVGGKAQDAGITNEHANIGSSCTSEQSMPKVRQQKSVPG